jgi:HEAT repeat protein
MGRAGNQSRRTAIRNALIEAFKTDPSLRETLARTFLTREDKSKEVQDVMLDALDKSSDDHETMALLAYFYDCGDGLKVEPFISLFNKSSNERIRRWAIKVLAEHADGEPAVVELLASCAESKDTPLALNCLSGLQLQSRKDSARTWTALEKTLESSDPDMLVATLDVVNALPEKPSALLTKRMIEIILETDDVELLDKAILGLGIAGDHSVILVETLQKLLKDGESQETTKIHAALILAKQATQNSDQIKEVLSACIKSTSSASVKSACQLGARELASRKKSKP